jgi:hypothetical protein
MCSYSHFLQWLAAKNFKANRQTKCFVVVSLHPFRHHYFEKGRAVTIAEPTLRFFHRSRLDTLQPKAAENEGLIPPRGHLLLHSCMGRTILAAVAEKTGIS